MKQPQTDRFDSAWDAVADTPEDAANLRVRAELMDKISELIAANVWTQVEAAAQCGLIQPRISDLLRGRISRFSLIRSAASFSRLSAPRVKRSHLVHLA